MKYYIRIRSNVWVIDSDGGRNQVRDLAPKDGSTLVLNNCLITNDLLPVKRLLISEERRKSNQSKFGIFCIASNEKKFNLSDVYANRFPCEETFKDVKDPLSGLGMSSVWISNENRRNLLLLFGSMAIFIMEIMGMSGDKKGVSVRFKPSSNKKKRTFSLRTVGFRIYDVLDFLSDKIRKPLLSCFALLLFKKLDYLLINYD